MEYLRRDWVTSAIECDASRVLEGLCAILQADADAAREHLGRGAGQAQNGGFYAACDHDWGRERLRRSVFAAGGAIRVNDENGDEIATALPTLVDDVAGEPKLKVSGALVPDGPKVMAVWEFSYLVLKDVFFPAPERPEDVGS